MANQIPAIIISEEIDLMRGPAGENLTGGRSVAGEEGREREREKTNERKEKSKK